MKQTVFIFFIALASCQDLVNSKEGDVHCSFNIQGTIDEKETDDAKIKGALLASRIENLEQLKETVQIEYFKGSGVAGPPSKLNTKVQLKHCCNGQEVVSVLREGISQGDIIDAKNGNIWDKLCLATITPGTIANRIDLSNIYVLARWRHDLMGWGDVAFYDIAKATENKIVTKDIAYKTSRDSSEKGYINTFNHITAQAIITSCYSEEIADFIADAHERHHMPELITGIFSKEQLVHPEVNPVDNYVDMINNEWGQEIGKKLKKKYRIKPHTNWTPELLANYLNDLQSYYSWAFQIGFNPFRAKDEVVIRFSKKINLIAEKMQGDIQ